MATHPSALMLARAYAGAVETEVRRVAVRTGVTLPTLITGPHRDVPLLLVHPWGESRRTFDRLVPLLPGLQVIAPDLRGQGEADKPDDGYSPAEQAEDAAALLEALGVDAVRLRRGSAVPAAPS